MKVKFSRDFKKNYSDLYQSHFCEIPTDLSLWDHLESDLSTQSEKYLDHIATQRDYLLDLLNKRLWELIDTYTTPKQREVVAILAEGATQNECAERLGRTQSTITKVLIGNPTRTAKNRGGNQKDGGLTKKVRVMGDHDEMIQWIHSQLALLDSGDILDIEPIPTFTRDEHLLEDLSGSHPDREYLEKKYNLPTQYISNIISIQPNKDKINKKCNNVKIRKYYKKKKDAQNKL